MAPQKSEFFGKCLEMCPAREIIEREKENILHKYEFLDGTKVKGRAKADPSKCVKQFSRPAAGQERQKQDEVRPPHILEKTVKYLISKILTLENEDWGNLYYFVFDRLRAVRQDLVVQNVWDLNCAFMYECIVRFHLYSIYKLSKHPIHVFDPHINSIHLQECLKRLLHFYMDTNHQSLSRCEMEAIYLLFNLGASEAISHALMLPKSIRSSDLICLSLQINFAWINGNFVRVLKNVPKLPFLCSVALMPAIGKIQRFGLHVMNAGYSAKNCNFPLQLLKQILLFNNESEANETCLYYGIKVEKDNVCFSKPCFKTSLTIKPTDNFQFLDEMHQSVKLPDVLYNEIK